MDKVFILEFNEKQQCFHFNYGQNEPSTFGWKTICKTCSDMEAITFQLYLDSFNKRKMTYQFVIKAWLRFGTFVNLLLENNITFQK